MALTIHDRPSPNHRARKGRAVRCIVIHADASPSTAATLDWCSRAESKVSYHYLIGRLGDVYRMVAESESAYHAGVSKYRGYEVGGGPSLNDVSIGVSLSNRQDGAEKFPPEQLLAAAELVADLCARHGVPLLDVQTHAAVAWPRGRKHDPTPGGPFSMTGFMQLVQKFSADGPSPGRCGIL